MKFSKLTTLAAVTASGVSTVSAAPAKSQSRNLVKRDFWEDEAKNACEGHDGGINRWIFVIGYGQAGSIGGDGDPTISQSSIVASFDSDCNMIEKADGWTGNAGTLEVGYNDPMVLRWHQPSQFHENAWADNFISDPEDAEIGSEDLGWWSTHISHIDDDEYDVDYAIGGVAYFRAFSFNDGFRPSGAGP